LSSCQNFFVKKQKKKRENFHQKYARAKEEETYVCARVPSLFSRAAFHLDDGFECDDETETRGGRRGGGKGRTHERAVVCFYQTIRRYRGEVCVSSFDEHGVTITLSSE
jgi:hypothetical protein